MYEFGEGLIIESYKVPWLIWIQLLVMILIVLLLFFGFSLFTLDLPDNSSPNSSAAGPSSSAGAAGQTHGKGPLPITSSSRHTNQHPVVLPTYAPFFGAYACNALRSKCWVLCECLPLLVLVPPFLAPVLPPTFKRLALRGSGLWIVQRRLIASVYGPATVLYSLPVIAPNVVAPPPFPSFLLASSLASASTIPRVIRRAPWPPVYSLSSPYHPDITSAEGQQLNNCLTRAVAGHYCRAIAGPPLIIYSLASTSDQLTVLLRTVPVFLYSVGLLYQGSFHTVSWNVLTITPCNLRPTCAVLLGSRMLTGYSLNTCEFIEMVCLDICYALVYLSFSTSVFDYVGCGGQDQKHSTEGGVETSTSRGIRIGEERDGSSVKDATHFRLFERPQHPCHYLGLAKQAFLKCLGLDSSSDRPDCRKHEKED
nr:uncharacterized protein LOC109174169 [Ipomoea batatas]